MLTPDIQTTELETGVAELVGILLETIGSDEATSDEIAGMSEGLARYAEQLESIALAAAEAGFLGLQDVCLLFQENLNQLRCQARSLSEAEREALEIWPALLMGYLEAPTEAETGMALLAHLQNGCWPQPLADDDAEVLAELLGSVGAQPDIDMDMDEQAADSGIDAGAVESEATAEPSASDETLPAPYSTESVEDGELANPADTSFETDAEADVDEHADADDADFDEAPSAMGGPSHELVEILFAEVVQMAESLEDITDADAEPEARKEALINYAEQMERFADASESIGLAGLQQVCNQLHENLSVLATAAGITADQRQLLTYWPDAVLAYLQALNDPKVCQELVQFLQNDHWTKPLPQANGAGLVDLLRSAQLEVEEVQVQERQQQAQPEDVSLELPDDVNPELLDSLLQELPNQAAEFSTAIQNLIEGEGTSKDVDVAQRIAHTLKGAGNTVGVRGIANLTHHIEDILLALSKQSTLPNRSLAQSLMNAADCLETMSETLLGLSSPPTQAINVLQEVLDWANRIDREGVPTQDEAPKATAPRGAKDQLANEKTIEQAPTPAAVSNEPMLRIPAVLVDELLRLVGENIILTGQVQEQARKTMRQTRAVQAQNAMFQQLTNELEQLVDIQNVSSPLARSVRDSDFDPLELEKYNELNTVTHRLVEIAADSEELNHRVAGQLTVLDSLLVNQGRLQRESQETVLRTRMVPVKTVVPRLQRSVRQTCRLTEKEVELEVSGVHTLMDSNVLNDLVDPLMHMLRNAIDHGIEPAEDREAAGKNPVGRIDLAFFREGNRVVVRCQDDGAGLNLRAIRHIAEQKGLINADQPLDDDELCRLILIPGFSTRAETTQTSGRGIGMDAVYSRVKELKGLLNIKSQPAQGCLLELRLPLTLISTHALLVRANKQHFALSDRGVQQILYPGLGVVRRLGNTTTYQLDDDIYAFTTLEELLNLPRTTPAVDDHCPVLLVHEDAGTTRAVMIQEVLDSRDMVIKNLGYYIPKLVGVAGATILGDGSVVPVLDLPDLLRAPLPPLISADSNAAFEADSADETPQHYALVVDDSLSARRSLAQFIEDAGFQVRTAMDGLEAINIIQETPPNLLLVDMEMPRMNGLELTAHVRANEATRHLPVIMITSRSTEKHRHEAKAVGVNFYMTKPFSEDELLKHIGAALGQSQ